MGCQVFHRVEYLTFLPWMKAPTTFEKAGLHEG